MIPELAAWFIFLLPLGSFVLIGFLIRPFLDRRLHASAGYATIGAIGGSFILSVWALGSVVEGHSVEIGWAAHEWMTVGNFRFTVGILMDPLTAIMLFVVTGVSLLIQIYSLGYMKGDQGFARYYAYMSLFTASMIGLVLARNVIQLFVFWELVGLCSYLLIGFWYKRRAAANAAKKAFIVTRIGDFGFLIGILYLFFNAGSVGGGNPLDIPTLNEAAKTGLLAGSVATWIAVGFFAGAIGKSGQFPLHTWLPDAMEGPTPVSALIHAATMVAAGVFLVARFFDVFAASPAAMDTVAIIGGFTAIFAASMGLVSNDIKRILAYSTVSQLGYMMLALGVGAYGPAIFHLFTHAFFKALLFLGSGNVNHATGTFDMRYMGGLRRVMPITHLCFLIGGLSLAGVFPLAGFWSKDEILASAWAGDTVSQVVFWLAIVAVFMTAFYMFRAVFMTFEGDFRGGAASDPDAPEGGHGVHLAESPLVMVVPVGVLAVAAVVAGFVANSVADLGVIPIHWLNHFLHADTKAFNIPLAAISSIVAVSGIGLAYLMYWPGAPKLTFASGFFRPAHAVLINKYYMDFLYENVLVRTWFYMRLAFALDWLDKSIVDGAVRMVDKLGRSVGKPLALPQTGQLQGYGMFISVGIVIIFGVFLIWR